jgi:DNA polymerase-3 subunit alpha
VARVKELGQEHVAITDHGVMYGAVQFYKEATAAGLHPIIGCEVYVASRSRFNMEYDKDAERFHLILLCKNAEGYRNLCLLDSMAFTEGYYIKPRIDMDILREHSAGLIALSACLSGKVPRLIAAGDYDGAKQHALEMLEIFGEGNYYLELQDHKLPDQRPVNSGLLRLHEDTGIPLVVTNDAHYIKREDAYAQDVLMCMQTGKTVDDPDRMRFGSEEFYVKSEDEMRALFPNHPEAYDNTVKIAEMCDFKFEFGKYHLPEFILPDGERDAEDYLKRLCLAGLETRYGGNPESFEDAKKQLFYELEMIQRMGFTDYFLIVHDFIKYAKEQGIPVGPGRGSAAGSIVSYCLDIITIDPMKYKLYFERFLNPERVSMPDIDIDFCERRRGEVIEYVRNKYGADRVAQIVTFNTLKAKNAVRNVSKAMGLTFAEENALAREIPNYMHGKLKDALGTVKTLREMYDGDERIRKVIDTALALEDMPKDSGTHASGVVITKNPVREYVPLTLSKKDDTIATQYTMTTLEELGLLKMDFLGLRNLTVLDDAQREIRRREPDFNLDTIPEDDAETYEMLAQGKTLGVFQLESAGMTGVAVGLQAKSIEDITAVIALYRPGPMESIPRFLENSKNPEKITYKHPSLEPILAVTYGCIVYQEQVLEILRRLAGFSLGQADMIRRAMSKKKVAEIEKARAGFIEGAGENGISQEIAIAIYDEIYDFANYAFNKAHAVGYAVVAYQTAYLKRHYPREYMAALMSSVLGLPEKVAEYTAECRDLGIQILPPDVNESGAMFSVSGEDIRYGLVAVKNIGRGFIENLVVERERNGKFTSFEAFVRRMYGGDMNRRAIESLIKCGALDGFGLRRSQLMAIVEPVMSDVADDRRRNVAGQLDMFGGLDDDTGGAGAIHIPNVPEYSAAEKLEMEHEVTGLYLSGHPADEYRHLARERGAVSIGGILAEFDSQDTDERFPDAQDTQDAPRKFQDGDEVTVLGAVTSVRTKMTKNNTQMAYVTLDDGTGAIETLVFQRVLEQVGGYLRPNAVLLLKGKISARDEKTPILMANFFSPVSDAEEAQERERAESQRSLYVKVPAEDDPRYARLQLVLTMFPGNDRLVVVLGDGRRLAAKCVAHEALVAEASEMFGAANVAIR